MALTLFRHLIDSLDTPVCLCDITGKVLILNKNARFVVDVDQDKSSVVPWFETRGIDFKTCMNDLQQKDELTLPFDESMDAYKVLLSGDQEEALVLLIWEDLNGAKKVLEDQSTHDLLTHLPKKAILFDRLEQSIIQAKRNNKSVALLTCRFEKLEDFESAYGEEFLQRLCRIIAEKLVSCVRNSDTVAMLNTKTFAMVFQVAAAQDGDIVARKVIRTMTDPIKLDGKDISLQLSVGMSLYPVDADSAQVLMECAHTAMDHAAKSGVNQYEFFATEMNVKAKTRILIEERLRSALQMKNFELYYQPKVDARDGKIVGAEGLIRWHDEKLGFVSPADFIPVAEESGLIVEIGYWVLKEACWQAVRWQEENLPKIRVSVNVSSRQLSALDFIEQLQVIIDDSGVDPSCLELEITESMLISNIDRTIETFYKIRNLGCHLSIDDFGTGYSSLSYLTRFPITTLKIDRAFIHDLEVNENTAEVARAIIGLSRGLSLEVVAEGAETEQHVNFLKEHGCETVQGFFYSKPLPAQEFKKLLREGKIESG